MLSPAPAPWIVRGATFVLWALAAGSAAYWGLKLTGEQRSLSAPLAAGRQVPAADPVAIARLLGATPSVAAAAAAAAPVVALGNRLQLVGVAAGEASGQGAALISVDGKPARSFRVGSTVEEGYVLKSVRGRQAAIASQGDGQVVAVLEVPLPKIDVNRPAAQGPAGARPLPAPVPVPSPLSSPPVEAGNGAPAPLQAPSAAPK